MTTRTLILMRHAKSAYPVGVIDHDRPLAARGEREAALAGDWLREHCPPIDAVLCSTSVRTRATLATSGIAASVTFTDRIYDAHPEDLLRLIRETPGDVQTLLLLGHGPGVPWLAWELATNHDAPAVVALGQKFPTSAIAVLHVPGDWVDLAGGTAEVTAFHVPR